MDSYDFNKVNENITEFQLTTKSSGATVVVKGKNDLILSGNKFRINRSGNAGMTVGGTGDALTGIIASLLSQNLNPFDAACLGVFINGLAGDKAYDEYGFGYSASQLVSFIGNVIKDGLC